MTDTAAEYVEPSTLVPWHKNPRKNDRAIPKVMESIQRYGFTSPIIARRSDRRVIAGHTRLKAALRLRLGAVPVRWVELTDAQALELTIADNKLGEIATWDESGLAELLASVDAPVLDLLGVTLDVAPVEIDGPPSAVGKATTASRTLTAGVYVEPGMVWACGPHRITCGDSTDPATFARLFEGEADRAMLYHADPPYGMNKGSVDNDDLHGAELDAFFVRSWRASLPFLSEVASAYVWGNPRDLWRLWYTDELHASQPEPLTFRNEIVWDKGNGFGMGSAEMRSYSVSTERCLFFTRGEIDTYREASAFLPGFAATLEYLQQQIAAVEWKAGDIKRICGVGMHNHWFTRSQWALMPRERYEQLQRAAARQAFLRPWDELRAEVARAAGQIPRAYFDGSWEAMGEVWQFPRVHGDERYGHDTPKPVAMVERIVKSSSYHGAIVLEPFLGSGSTLIACERQQRRCFGVELRPAHVETTLIRWAQETGQEPRKIQ